ncbi:MAG TPA: hypothetical protein VN903_02220 [Polyangia bacterium]|jgi:hypothetical protein|nr:hypothetical protein [Polyangia bacterium]
MKAFRTVVVAAIIGAMFSPAMALAKSEPRTAPVAAQQIASTAVALKNVAASTMNAQASESARYAQREQQSQDVQNFKGGAVYVYFGSGLVLALIIIILILV